MQGTTKRCQAACSDMQKEKPMAGVAELEMQQNAPTRWQHRNQKRFDEGKAHRRHSGKKRYK
jgi:hypothetical protein